MKRLNMDMVMDGAVVYYPEANKDETVPWFKVAHMGGANKHYSKVVNKITAPHRIRLQHGSVPEAEAAKMFREAFIQAILIDWGNIQPDDDGEVLPFSHENADEFFGNPEFHPVWEWVQAEAQNLENYRILRLETEAKN